MNRELYPANVLWRITITFLACLSLILCISIAFVPSAAKASQPSDTYNAIITAILLSSQTLPDLSGLNLSGLNLSGISQLSYSPQTAASSYKQNSLFSDDLSLLRTLSAAYYNPLPALYLSPLNPFSLSSANPSLSSALLNRTAASQVSSSVNRSSGNLPSVNQSTLGLILPSQANLQPLNRAYPASIQGGYSFSPISYPDLLNQAPSLYRASSATVAGYQTPGSLPYGLGAAGITSPFAPFTPFFTGVTAAQPHAIINGGLISWPPPATRRIAAVASLVLANPTQGMYCWDPAGWLSAGFQVNIWGANKPVRAQSFDNRGFLLDAVPTFSVDPTGQAGSMTLLRADNLLFEGLINAAGPADYLTTVTVDTASTVTVMHRRNATCDVCHPTPPGHIANPATWGKCNTCHVLANVIHVHAYNAYIDVGDCYQCHPTGCLSGLHGQIGLWCTNCHGSLLDAPNGQMKVSGQLGKPYCADCHDQQHSENLPALYMDSAGHGGVWCVNCHGATHVEYVKPFGYKPLGYNNCEACHTVQAAVSWMGPNCGVCHGSSVSPHLVDR